MNFDALPTLFQTTFTASEGAEEGLQIGALAAALLDTQPEDLRVFADGPEAAPIAAVLFSRMTFVPPHPVTFLLSPMAVHPDHQGKGLGQGLIRQALESLRAEGVELAITYGDPAFYGKVGFEPVTIEHIPAPQPLSFPHGWIAQNLGGGPLPALQCPASCAAALNNPAFW